MSGHVSAPTHVLQLFLIVRAGSSDDDFLRRNFDVGFAAASMYDRVDFCLIHGDCYTFYHCWIHANLIQRPFDAA